MFDESMSSTIFGHAEVGGQECGLLTKGLRKLDRLKVSRLLLLLELLMQEEIS